MTSEDRLRCLLGDAVGQLEVAVVGQVAVNRHPLFPHLDLFGSRADREQPPQVSDPAFGRGHLRAEHMGGRRPDPATVFSSPARGNGGAEVLCDVPCVSEGAMYGAAIERWRPDVSRPVAPPRSAATLDDARGDSYRGRGERHKQNKKQSPDEATGSRKAGTPTPPEGVDEGAMNRPLVLRP